MSSFKSRPADVACVGNYWRIGPALETAIPLATWHVKLETIFMRLLINGREQDFPDSLRLTELVEQLGMKSDRVAVELNREIVSRHQWPGTSLKEGDRLEIVHFVGGG